MKRLLPLLLLPALAQASMFATGGEETILGDDTAVHAFTNSGTFTMSQTKIVRILVVGGGGGGGGECGGGGGGGGVIEELAYELPAGTYGITIGAGGLGGREGTDRGNGNERGGNGGDTVVTNSAGTELFRALGGGGGGAWANRSGVNGGCGGGAAATGAGGIALDAAQGNPAGNPKGGSEGLPTGGGGAGAASEDVSFAKGAALSGAGGAGRTSDISGLAQMYGAGGGGGNYNYSGASAQAPGGDGIGGFGMGNVSTLSGNEKGRDGFGGGGGGGSNVRTYIAGAGGSGVVVIRLPNTDAVSPDPIFTVSATAPAMDSVVFTVAVSEAGSLASDGTVAVYAQIAEDASAWDAQTGAFGGTEQMIGTNLVAGAHALRAVGLRASHAYVARIVVRNDGPSERTSDDIAFTTAALSEARWSKAGVQGFPGLLQFRYAANYNDLDRAFDETSAGLTLQIGAIAAGLSNHQDGCLHGRSYTDANGGVWTVGSNISYGYVGYMWMEAGTDYTFFKYFYDGVRLEIDGTDVIRNADYNQTTIATYACTKTGWHRIRVWLTCPGGTNFGAPTPWTFSLGWNTNGVTDVSGKPGSGWTPLENTAENVFLRTAPQGRTVDISSWSLDAGAGTATFDAALGEGTDPTALYAVWGPFHGGDTTNGWTHVARVGSAAIGTAAATASFTVPDASDLTWFRFVAIDGDDLCAWSPGQLVDLSNPAIAIAGVTHDGDRATVSIRVDSVGTGTFSLRLLWGENAGLSGASSTNLAVSGTGTYDVTVPVKPGATTYYRAEASTSDGGSDATAVSSFTTLAGSVLSSSKNASVAQHWITFSGSLATAGAGTTAVTLWIGESPDALVADPEPVLLTAASGFSFRRLFPGEPRTIYWKLTSTNTAAGGTSWSSETAAGSANTTEGEVNYTWKAGVAEGDWSDTNNWTTSTEGAFGYPAYVGAYAAFAAGTTARVLVDGAYESRIRIFDRSNVDVTLAAGTNAVSSLYTGDSYGGSFANSTLTLDGMTLEEQDFFDWWVGSSASGGARLAVTNGGVLKLGGGGAFGIAGTNSCIVVGPGSAFLFGDPDTVYRNVREDYAYLVLATLGEVATVEGRFVARSLHPETPEGEEGQRMRIRGPGGIVRVANGIFGDVGVINADHGQSIYKTPHPVARDFGIVFEPVQGSFTNTVSYAVDGTTFTNPVALVSTADGGRAMGGMILDESVGKIRLSVDVTSMRHSPKSAKQHFVLWRTGIDTNHVELVPGRGYALSYTYGWPSTNSAPAVAGDLPTGVWADVPAQAATMLLMK